MRLKGISNKRISDTDLDQQFIDQSERLGILCFNDFMNADIPTLKKHPSFSMTWYTEFLKVLRKENLLQDFQKKL